MSLPQAPSRGRGFAVSTEYQGKAPSAAMRNARTRFRYWYDNIIDWMLLNPGKPLRACAAAIGRSESSLYLVTNTDVFRSRLAQRRQEYNDKLGDDLIAASSAVAISALNEIQERIASNPAKIPFGSLADVADKALNRLGYGVAPINAAPTVNVTQQVVVSPSALRDAQEKMRQVQALNAQDITPSASSKPIESILEDEYEIRTISSS